MGSQGNSERGGAPRATVEPEYDVIEPLPTPDPDSEATDAAQRVCMLCGQPVLREGSECYDCRRSRPEHLRQETRTRETNPVRTALKLGGVLVFIGCLANLGSLANLGEPAVRWSARTGGRVSGMVAVAGNCVVAATEKGRVLALDEETGAERWSFATEEQLVGGILIDRGLVYFVTSGEAVHALDLRAGTERWRAPAPGVAASTALTDRHVLVGIGDALVAIDRNSGDEAWRFVMDHGQIVRSIAAGRRSVYIGYGEETGEQGAERESGGLCAVDLETRVSKWALELECVIERAPILTADLVCVVGRPQGVGRAFGVFKETGDLVWRRDNIDTELVRWRESLLHGEERPDGDGGWFVARDVSSGEAIWRRDYTGRGLTSPQVLRETVLFGAGKAIWALRPRSGSVRWKLELEAPCGVMAFGVGHAYVATPDHAVHALRTN